MSVTATLTAWWLERARSCARERGRASLTRPSRDATPFRIGFGIRRIQGKADRAQQRVEQPSSGDGRLGLGDELCVGLPALRKGNGRVGLHGIMERHLHG